MNIFAGINFSAISANESNIVDKVIQIDKLQKNYTSKMQTNLPVKISKCV